MSAMSAEIEKWRALAEGHAGDAQNLSAENRLLWLVINKLVAKADVCHCTHDDENCCAKVGEDCIICALYQAGLTDAKEHAVTTAASAAK